MKNTTRKIFLFFTTILIVLAAWTSFLAQRQDRTELVQVPSSPLNKRINADELAYRLRGGGIGTGQPTKHRAVREIPSNAGTLDPDEALKLVRKDLESIVHHFKSAPVSQRTVNDRPQLKGLKLAELRDLESVFRSNKPAKVLFDNNQRLKALYPELPLSSTSIGDSETVSTVVKGIMVDYQNLFGLEGGAIGDVETSCIESICRTTVSKTFGGLPAWDHSLVVSTSVKGIFAITGEFDIPDILDVPNLRMNVDDIHSVIADYFEVPIARVDLLNEPEQGIAREGAHDFFGYRVTASLGPTDIYEVYLDHQTEKVVKSLPLVFQAAVPASGINLNGESVSFEANQISTSSYEMMDSSFPLGHSTTLFSAPSAIFDDPFLGAEIVTSSSPNSGWNAAAVSALDNAKMIIDYFKTQHGYDAVNEQGKPLNIVVNGNYSNALAFGDSLFTFGSGDGVGIGNFAGSLDVMAHEITHGVISSSSNLVYRYQSGALNESFADIFAAMLDADDWTIGEDLFNTPGSFLRSMSNPSAGGQPGHFSQYLYTSDDDGGVHTNSGIANRAFYLLAEGLTDEALGESIGRFKAAQIAFQTMRALPSNASFFEAASLMEIIAGQLYGIESPEQQAVTRAWQLVGIPSQGNTSTVGGATYIPPSSNVLLYLNPVFDVSVTAPVDNFYNLYSQIYFNESPSYLPDLNFGPLNGLQPSSLTRPTIVVLEDDTFLTMYKGIDGSLYLYDSATGEETALDLSGYTISDLTISQDFNTLIFALEDSPIIISYNLATEVATETIIRGPVFTENSQGRPVTYVDTLRFDPTSRFVVFDFLTCSDPTSSDCSGSDAVNYWSIGILDLDEGTVSYPFPSQPSSVDIGFPSFSNMTDQYLVFDLIFYDSNTATSGIYIYDRYSATLGFVANPDVTASQFGFFGTPSFSADDTSITFAVRFDGQVSLIYSAALEDYALTSQENKYTEINPFLGHLPISIPLIAVNRVPSLSLSTVEIDFGGIEFGSVASEELCAENSGDFPIDISAFSEPSLTWTGSNHILISAEKICGDLRLDTSQLIVGTLNSVTVSLIHDGANSPIPLSISAVIGIDTDADGVLNYIDADDDNDGISDVFENANGLDSLDATDAGKDADGDNISNLVEFQEGTNPNDANDGGDACLLGSAKNESTSSLSLETRLYLANPGSNSNQQTFLRFVNPNASTTSIEVYGIDDGGGRSKKGAFSFTLGPQASKQINAQDIEDGNTDKGLSSSLCDGQGKWQFRVRSDNPIKIIGLIRTPDGFLTSLNDVVPKTGNNNIVYFANPASNTNQQTFLRIVNTSSSSGRVTISGIDDAGVASLGSVSFSLGSFESKQLTAQDLENGNSNKGLTGNLDNGSGKWRITVSSSLALEVMSLIRTPDGFLTNLSGMVDENTSGDHVIYFANPASEAVKTTFLRIINTSAVSGTVTISAIDDAGNIAPGGDVMFDFGANESKQMIVKDLEEGNLNKGLLGMIGDGEGRWRLTVSSSLSLEVMSLVRTPDGFLTNLSRTAPVTGNVNDIYIFNPGSNLNQRSSLRIVNDSSQQGSVTISAFDDTGAASPGGNVTFDIAASSAISVTAQDLENGNSELGLVGALGDGSGKWRLQVTSDVALQVQSLLDTPTGFLTNLSQTAE